MHDSENSRPQRYIVKSILHAVTVLGAFHSAGEVLQLREVAARTGLGKGMCFRLLYTLHECGLIEKVGKNQYRNVMPHFGRRKYRLGYADQDRRVTFSQEVFHGLVRAAERRGIELITVDNRRDPKVAVSNADRLISEHVDLAIEFQIDEAVAPVIASKFRAAGIPFIAVDVPHPGAIYFGADNYRAGLLGGHCLADYARRHWQGGVEEILMVEIARAGPLPRMRIDGMLAGILEAPSVAEHCRIVRIDGTAEFRNTLDRVRRYLFKNQARRILVGAATGPLALGALRAFQEAGRAADCAVVGHDADHETRAELRVPQTRLIGCVAYFPERYGEGIVRLAVDVLSGKSVPPAVFIGHKLITPQNVDHFYPNDALFFPTIRE
jgi:ribose transport system substrate-binding protein